MANLRDVSLISQYSTATFKIRQQQVYNGQWTAGVQNGGACCCFIVPAGSTYIQFELWGAGGDGAGACCCEGPVQAPGTGQYVKKTINTPAGYYNICAAGTGCCAQGYQGGCGFPSFVTQPGGTVIACAGGGAGGCTYCGHMGGQSCYGNCCGGIMCCCNLCGDLCMGYIQNNGDHENNFCTNRKWNWRSGALKYQGNTTFSSDTCAIGMYCQGCGYWQQQQLSWPGGPGTSAQVCGGPCCWGQWGSSGLVVITYG